MVCILNHLNPGPKPFHVSRLRASVPPCQHPKNRPLDRRCLILPPVNASVSLSSFGGEGWGEEAVTSGGSGCLCLPQRLRLSTAQQPGGGAFSTQPPPGCEAQATRTWPPGRLLIAGRSPEGSRVALARGGDQTGQAASRSDA